MIRYITLVLALLFSIGATAKEKQLNVYISYCTFNSPQDGPYVETYFAFQGNTVNFVPNSKGMLQGKLEILILFKQNDSIKAFQKYNLFSPEIEDTTKAVMLFHDQQRISVPNGNYTMEISIRDVNGTEDPYIISEPISILFNSNEIQVSGIELLQSAKRSDAVSLSTKAGYELLPLPLNFYPPTENKLMFYFEMYNMLKVLGDSSKYLLRMSVEELQTSRKVPGMLFQKRMDSKDVEAIIHEFDITGLATGDYYLVLEVKDRNNELMAVNRIYFERRNDIEQVLTLVDDAYVRNSFVYPISNVDTLREYIRCLRPISTALEKDYVDDNLLTSDLLTLQRFFLNFWIQRNEADPQTAWMKYYADVVKVNYNYSTMIRKGYDTDRGRIYLQYGPPNTITEVPSDPAAYPYEIWHYYTLNTQSNRKFVFCNFDLITNDFEMVHSDAIGELYDGNWQNRVNKAKASQNTRDRQDGQGSSWGSRMDDYYNIPR